MRNHGEALRSWLGEEGRLRADLPSRESSRRVESLVIGAGRRLARRLERASEEPGIGLWERTRARWSSTVARPLAWPAETRVVGVGGATIGGSGRTPVAIAIVEALVARGHSVAMVGHAYGARPGRPRVVRAEDPIAESGDEAVIAARALGDRAPVIVAPDRQAAMDLAARLSSIVVVDRLAQARPRRVNASVLALDGVAPWGSGRSFPLGDLAHPRAHLLEASDVIVRVDGDDAASALSLEFQGTRGPIGALAQLPFGLVTSAARPMRIVRELARAGAHARVHVERGDHQPLFAGDHARLDRLAARVGIERWVVDAKTAVRLSSGARLSVPVARLDHRVTLAARVIDAIEARCR